MVNHREPQFKEPAPIDFVAVSLADCLAVEADLVANPQAHCRFKRELGLFGLGWLREAACEFQQTLPLCEPATRPSRITTGPHCAAGSPSCLSSAASDR